MHMEGSPSSRDDYSGLTARVLPALYLFGISVVAGVIIGHAATTLVYRPKALHWLDALAIPLLFFGYTAFKGHLRALEEHTEEEYLKALRKGVSPYVITFIAVVSLASGLVTGGIYAVDDADRKLAEKEAKELNPMGRHAPAQPVQKKNSPSLAQKVTSNAQALEITINKTNAPQLALKSIISDSTRRTALINNIVLGEGQSSAIKVDGSIFQVKCLKIEEDAVILEMNGQTNRITLKL
jgi:hypothetical protein